MENLFDLVLMLIFIVSAWKKPLLCPFLTDWTRTFFCRKIKKSPSMKEEMDGEVYISRQSRHLSFIDDMIEILFPNFTFKWSVNNYVSCQGKSMIRKKESTNIIIKICSLWYCNPSWKLLKVLLS